MAQFQGNLLKNVIHFGCGSGKESFAARDVSEFVEDALAFHTERAARIVATQNSDTVQHHVRFLQQAPDLTKGVARIVVLPVADQEQGPLAVSAPLDLLNSEIAGIVESCVVLGLNEGEFIKYGIAVARFVQQQLRAR